MPDVTVCTISQMTNIAVLLGYSVNKIMENYGKPILRSIDPKVIEKYKDNLSKCTVFGYNIPGILLPGLCITMNDILRESGHVSSYSLPMLD